MKGRRVKGKTPPKGELVEVVRALRSEFGQGPLSIAKLIGYSEGHVKRILASFAISRGVNLPDALRMRIERIRGAN